MCAHSINSPYKRQLKFHGRPDVIQKDCEWCGKAMMLQPGDSLTRFKRNKACSANCSTLLASSKQSEFPSNRICEVCGCSYLRRDGEQLGNYKKRKTCSKECSAKLRGKNKRRFHQLDRDGLAPSDSKPCDVCNSTFTRGNDEARSDFERRRTCSEVCRAEQISISKVALRKPLPDKWCSHCGERIERRLGESLDYFKQRRTCATRECRYGAIGTVRGFFERSGLDPKPCPICGVVMVCGDDEMPGMFKRRRTCGDKDCRYQQMIRSTFGYTERRSPYPMGWNVALRTQIKERDGNQCARCGDSDSQLHVHHINYQKRDCRPYNLVTLCNSCHGKMNGGDRLKWKEECRSYVDRAA